MTKMATAAWLPASRPAFAAGGATLGGAGGGAAVGPGGGVGPGGTEHDPQQNAAEQSMMRFEKEADRYAKTKNNAKQKN